MSRSRILAIAAVLIVFSQAVWVLWPPAEKSAAPSNPVGASIRRIEQQALQRAQLSARETSDPDRFAFKYGGKTVTVDLTKARESLHGLSRLAPVSPSTNDPATVSACDADFLSWPSRQYRDEERRFLRRCWVIDFTNSPSRSAEDPRPIVRAHISQDDGSVMCVRTYNWSGKLTSEFKVNSWKRADDGTLQVKAASVSHFVPGTLKVAEKLEFGVLPWRD